MQFGDLPEFCDFDYIARVARVNAAALWSLAQAPGHPAGRHGSTRRSSPTTPRCTGPRGTEPDLAGYEVVWRPTTTPDWTHVIPVGDVTTATIDLSKDNVLLRRTGGRTATGHRSPAVFPVPPPPPT